MGERCTGESRCDILCPALTARSNTTGCLGGHRAAVVNASVPVARWQPQWRCPTRLPQWSSPCRTSQPTRKSEMGDRKSEIGNDSFCKFCQVWAFAKHKPSSEKIVWSPESCPRVSPLEFGHFRFPISHFRSPISDPGPGVGLWQGGLNFRRSEIGNGKSEIGNDSSWWEATLHFSVSRDAMQGE